MQNLYRVIKSSLWDYVHSKSINVTGIDYRNNTLVQEEPGRSVSCRQEFNHTKW